MFGTIAHATLKPGQRQRLDEFMEEWRRDVRPKVPGSFLELVGHQAGKPDQIVFVALAQDEPTYRRLAAMPEQHEFYLRFNEVFTGEPTWEDVELDIRIDD
ncbi:MAG TPA: hypothetical protein VFX03_06950 [Thermomicrobiales bacterium]|nr:hypothetical protein [Thermomicrobiales bacterium]